MNEFEYFVAGCTGDALHAGSTEVLQTHLGLLCNQRCSHCHFDCGPDRTEIMSWPVMERVISMAAAMRPRLVDINGGAPELNPRLRDFIIELRKAGHKVRLRTNLSALAEPGLDGLPAFLRRHQVKLAASLPCYVCDCSPGHIDNHVFEKSIRALGMLAEAGYAMEPGLFLNHIYNSGGAALPGKRAVHEASYRRELFQHYNINFSRLSLITSTPADRHPLVWRRRPDDIRYTALLKKSFNPETLNDLNCRHQVTVRWDGAIFDCELNLALGIRATAGADAIQGLDTGRLSRRRIVTGEHCFCCTAAVGATCEGGLERSGF